MRLLFVFCVVLVGLLVCGVLVCPVSADNTNLAPISSEYWGTVDNFPPNGLPLYDYGFTHTGYPSINMSFPSSYNSECDNFNPAFVVEAGVTRVYWSAWIYAGDSSDGDDYNTWDGARMGMDFFGSQGRITGWIGSGTPEWNSDGSQVNDYRQEAVTVHWGSKVWTNVVIDFVVPELCIADDFSEYEQGSYVEPTYIGTYFDVSMHHSAVTTACAWYADSVFYLDPSGVPTPAPTPTGSPIASSVPVEVDGLGEGVGVVALLTVVSSFMGALAKFKRV